MNRNIIFRARRKDNGDFIDGYYLPMIHNDSRNHTHHFIIPIGADLSTGTTIDSIQVEIDLETLELFSQGTDGQLKEMLCVERDVVQRLFKKYVNTENQLTAILLLSMFDNKCRSDNDLN